MEFAFPRDYRLGRDQARDVCCDPQLLAQYLCEARTYAEDQTALALQMENGEGKRIQLEKIERRMDGWASDISHNGESQSEHTRIELRKASDYLIGLRNKLHAAGVELCVHLADLPVKLQEEAVAHGQQTLDWQRINTIASIVSAIAAVAGAVFGLFLLIRSCNSMP
jgi:hypothetical protein